MIREVTTKITKITKDFAYESLVISVLLVVQILCAFA